MLIVCSFWLISIFGFSRSANIYFICSNKKYVLFHLKSFFCSPVLTFWSCWSCTRTWYTIKTKCINLQNIDPETSSILIFLEKSLGIVSTPYFVNGFSRKMLLLLYFNILLMVFQEKCFSCYILLSDQISLSVCLYFLRQWAIRVL